jgi:hypothetical protein
MVGSFSSFGRCHTSWFTAKNVSYPTCESSALELISPDSWVTMDGYVVASLEI